MLGRSAHNVLDVADAEIEALRADRRKHMRGLADQRDAVAGKARRQQRRQRIDLPAWLDPDAAEHRLHFLLDLDRQRRIVERRQLFRRAA